MSAIEKEWLKSYDLFKEYCSKYGNMDILYSYEVDGVRLRRWLTDQRKFYKQGKLTKVQIQLLELLGIKWSEKSQNWDEHYWLLEDYYKEHGNIDVPNLYQIDNVNLGRWLNTQRQAFKNQRVNSMTDMQIKALETLKVKWCIREEKWDEWYYLLEDYYKEHGNINVPIHYEVNNFKLGIWLNVQRQSYKGSNGRTLSDDKIQLLDDLGMRWDLCSE